MSEPFLEPYTLEVHTLSPLHIGTGVKLGKADFFMQNGHVHVISENKLMSWIARQPDAEKLAIALADNLGNPGSGIRDFIRGHYSGRGRLPEIVAYSLPYAGSPRDISTFIKDANYQPYMPGSSVKGVLRGALLRGEMIDDIALRQHAQQEIRRGARKERPKTNSDQIQARLFASSAPQAGKAPNYDLNRLLLVRDSLPLNTNILAVIQVKVFSIEAKGGWRWKQKPFKGSYADMDLYVEAIPAGRDLTHHVVWQAHLLREQAQKLGFGSSEHLVAFLPEYGRRASLNLLSQEHEFYRRNGFGELADWFEKRINQLSDESFILPMGWGSGYDAKTITDLLGSDIFELVVDKYKNTQGLGKPGRRRDAQWLGADDSPKSRKVVVHGDESMEPMGWVEMHLLPEDQARDWLKARRNALSDKKPAVHVPSKVSSPTPAQRPSTPAAEPVATPRPAVLPPTPLTERFTTFPKPGDRFRGAVWFTDEDGSVWVEIPGLSADDYAAAVIGRNRLGGRKFKDGASLLCKVISVEADPVQKGQWIVHCELE